MTERPLEPPEEPVVHCPVCGAEDPELVVTDPVTHLVMGCDVCLEITPGWKFGADD